MPDPFDLNELKRSTPKYHDLKSDSGALCEIDSLNINNDIAQAECIGDVTMEDQSLEELGDCCIEDDMKDISSDEGDENSELVSDENKIDSLIIHPKDELPTDREKHHSTLRQIFSPTQSGAQLALRDDIQNNNILAPNNSGYQYEIKLPIPAAWGASLPYILSTYLQLSFNFMLYASVAWILFVFNKDVRAKIRERAIDTIHKAAWCQDQYFLNDCHKESQRPYLADSKFCMEMERCMNLDPNNVRWLSMHASLIAEVVNELVEPITTKTMLSLSVLVVLLGCTVFAINYIFGFIRARTYLHSNSANQKADSNANLNDNTISLTAKAIDSR